MDARTVGAPAAADGGCGCDACITAHLHRSEGVAGRSMGGHGFAQLGSDPLICPIGYNLGVKHSKLGLGRIRLFPPEKKGLNNTICNRSRWG